MGTMVASGVAKLWHRVRVNELLRAVEVALAGAVGRPVTIRSAGPVTEGWSAGHGAPPNITRCVVDGPIRSVIVKIPRNAARERAALTLLEEIGSDAGPRLLAHGEGFVVLEDLGAGLALEDLLVGADPEAATRGFVAFAEAVGRMHAATLGRAEAFYRRLPELDPRNDRVCLAGAPVDGYWQAVRDLASPAADRDVAAVREWMSGDRLLALSNGDVAPQNCRLGNPRARLLDFERAQYQHVLLDAAHLRLPFYGGPCWSRIPAGVGQRVEAAYRTALNMLDEHAYRSGMAAATAAWAIVRLVRLPKLLPEDPPHPMGYSRRGQLLDTLQVAVDASRMADTLPALRTWFEAVVEALRRRWPGLPPRQEVYPVYRARTAERRLQ
jgi:hypothetical protein